MATVEHLPANTPVIDEVRAIPRRWLSVKGAAAYSTLPEKAIRTAIQRAELSRRKIGKRFVIDVRELDDWLTGEKVRQ